MAYLLFVDESGQDHKESPYEVLAGVAAEDSRIWSIIVDLHEAEVAHFGQRISQEDRSELKARKLLKRKVFRHAAEVPSIAAEERRVLAQACLLEGRSAKLEDRGARVTRRQLAALAQAKIAFAQSVLEICSRHQTRAFASIVDRDAPRSKGHFLRKDYAYLFERFFSFLDEQPLHQQGLVVFDELERSRSHVLVSQMAQYFKETAKGRLRASRVVPEPFFVHSDLTSLVQVADLIAYIIVWAVRIENKMHRPARDELKELASIVSQLRYRATRDQGSGPPFYLWSFAVIDDLRSAQERA